MYTFATATKTWNSNSPIFAASPNETLHRAVFVFSVILALFCFVFTTNISIGATYRYTLLE